MKQPTIPQIPGVDQLDGVEADARAFAGPFMLDEIELLVKTARGLRDRAKHFIAPEGQGFTIYRRASKS